MIRLSQWKIQYSANGELAQALQGVFASSYDFIRTERELREPGSRKHIALPEDRKEYLAIYTTEYDDSYVFEPILSHEVSDVLQLIKDKSERAIETEFDLNEEDPNAGYEETEALRKIRKLDHKIGSNLKLLYSYRCQICGRMIGEEFGMHVAEAHHIDYFIHSLNNDARNQIVLCPNHHSLIHAADPVFNRKKLLYVYSNGMEQKIQLNKHL